MGTSCRVGSHLNLAESIPVWEATWSGPAHTLSSTQPPVYYPPADLADCFLPNLTHLWWTCQATQWRRPGPIAGRQGVVCNHGYIYPACLWVNTQSGSDATEHDGRSGSACGVLQTLDLTPRCAPSETALSSSASSSRAAFQAAVGNCEVVSDPAASPCDVCSANQGAAASLLLWPDERTKQPKLKGCAFDCKHMCVCLWIHTQFWFSTLCFCLRMKFFISMNFNPKKFMLSKVIRMFWWLWFFRNLNHFALIHKLIHLNQQPHSC